LRQELGVKQVVVISEVTCRLLLKHLKPDRLPKGLRYFLCAHDEIFGLGGRVVSAHSTFGFANVECADTTLAYRDLRVGQHGAPSIITETNFIF